MFVLANSFSFLSYHLSENQCLISSVSAFLLVYPTANYYIKISSCNDFDFMNIFLQSIIFKNFLFSFGIFINYFSNFIFYVVN